MKGTPRLPRKRGLAAKVTVLRVSIEPLARPNGESRDGRRLPLSSRSRGGRWDRHECNEIVDPPAKLLGKFDPKEWEADQAPEFTVGFCLAVGAKITIEDYP